MKKFLIAMMLLVATSAASSNGVPLEELARPGRVLMLRHAYAPGIGDPDNFRIGDCASQRNLDSTGREQAAQIGRRLAIAGVTEAAVYSSQWCRCLETAKLLGLGPVTELPALNSFFSLPEKRELSISALRRFLAGLPTSGPPVVLVTHQVTVTGLTGIYSSSGSGVILMLNGTGEPKLIGEALSNKP